MKSVYAILFTASVLISCKKSPQESEVIPTNTDDQTLQQLLIENSETNNLDFYIQPNSSDYSSIPQDPNNPLNEHKVKLGQFLFFETGLAILPVENSGKNTFSCATCHNPFSDFQAGVKQAIGDGGLGHGLIGEGRHVDPSYIIDSVDVQGIRTPSSVNTAFQEAQLWNGQFGATGINGNTQGNWDSYNLTRFNNLGYEGLETQAIAAIINHRLGVDSIIKIPEYKSLFDLAFPDFPLSERYTDTTAGLAMAAYERTTFSNESPFQNYLKGDVSALTSNQKKGAILFFDKAKCVQCHTGPALNSMDFYALGMNELSGPDVFSGNQGSGLGRGGFTNDPNDYYKFKVPQIYNLKNQPFLGHGSSFSSIKEVIEYKNDAVKENFLVDPAQLSPEFVPLNLTPSEIDLLTDFVENGLYDPNLVRYAPSYIPSGFCFPNNDPESKVDLACN